MYKNIIKIWILLVTFSVWIGSSNLQAQDVELRVSVSKNKIGLNENFEYKIEVSGKKTDLPAPALPELDGLAPLSGPNTSTSIQFINGSMSASKTFSYILQPRRIGTIRIPPISMEIDGETITSNEIVLTVSKASPQQQQSRKQTPKSTTDPDISGENLFLKTILDKKNVYQNEQIIITYKLYFRVSVRSYNIDKIPSNTGLWTEEFKLPSQPRIENEVINGVTYQVATLRKVAVFPTRSGKIELEPMAISVDAVVKRKRSSRSLFDSFFEDPFGRTVRKTVATKSTIINVKPTPEQNKPANFSGEVGRFNLQLITDKTELQANEAASIKLIISGNGNIKLLKPPEIKFPTDMEVYDPKEKTNIKREKNRVTGNKTIEYIVVPRFAGSYTIRPVSFSYFDPGTKTYKNLVSKPINLNILEGAATPGAGIVSGNLSKQEVELLGEDIRFIKETANIFPTGTAIYKSWYYIILYIFPLIGLVISWLYSRQRDILRNDLQLARRKKAGKIAAKHLTSAKKYLKPDSGKDFYREISLAIQGFVCDKLNIQLTDFSGTISERKLKDAGVDEKFIEEYKDCLQESDYRQFAGASDDLDDMKAFYEQVRTVLTQLEKNI